MKFNLPKIWTDVELHELRYRSNEHSYGVKGAVNHVILPGLGACVLTLCLTHFEHEHGRLKLLSGPSYNSRSLDQIIARYLSPALNSSLHIPQKHLHASLPYRAKGGSRSCDGSISVLEVLSGVFKRPLIDFGSILELGLR